MVMHALVVIGLLVVQVFVVLRLRTHFQGLRSGAKVARNGLAALTGFVGFLVLLLAIFAVWASVAFTVYDWLRNSRLEGLYFIVGSVLASPILLLFGEMLINVSYRDEWHG